MSTKNFKNEITITSKTENLSQVRDFIKSIAETCGFTKEEIGKKLFITPTFQIEPLEGVIVLFPSDLSHAVQKNNSEEDRISVSFNIDLRNCVT